MDKDANYDMAGLRERAWLKDRQGFGTKHLIKHLVEVLDILEG
jgi:hypothetical protein